VGLTQAHGAALAAAMTVFFAAEPTLAQAQGAAAQTPSGLFPQAGRPYFLAGRVVLEDGSPPPEPVPIVRSCGSGAGVPLGFTDTKGRFTFGAGTDSSAMMDVQNRDSTNPFASGYSDPMGCELRAVATGFSSDAVSLGTQRLLDSPDVGVIVLRRLEGIRGSTFSETTLRAKEGARKAFENGRQLSRKEKYDEAAREFEKAVQAAPGFAAAWFELGLVRQLRGRIEEARKAYRASVAADPEFVKPYRQLAVLSFQEQDWPAVLEATDRLLWLDPISYADAYSYDAVARLYTGQLEKAEKSAREASRLDPDFKIPRSRYVLAAVLIEKRDYSGAATALRDYIAHASPGPELEQARSMLSQLDARQDSSPSTTPR
jgi:tetratricopeptide (TPR) repeat protein